jgi:uncharacterized membrane protein YeaQ/YmgE (transglycosylase-associated protein family)
VLAVTFWGIIWYVIAGLIIGAVARLILPGRQQMNVWWTIILGVVAAVIGGWLWSVLFSGNEGIAWIGSIIVAVVILLLYERVMASGRSGSS